MGKKKTIKFSVLNLMIGLLPMTALAIVVMILVTRIISEEVTELETEKLRAASLTLGEYFAYDVRENGYVDYDEYSDHVYVQILKDVDIDLTLFEGDTRLITSLKNEDGSWNEGTQASKEVWDAVSKGEDYTAKNLVIGGEKYLVYYTPVYSDDAGTEVWGMAFAGTPMTSITEMQQKAAFTVIIVTLVCVVVFGIVVFLISKRFSTTLNELASHIKMLASGNISQKKRMTSVCAEFDQVATSLDVLQDELTDAIGAIYQTSQELGEAVNVVDRLSGESSDGTNQISNVIGQMADTAQTMAENVQDANSAMIRMSESIENIENASSSASNKAAEMRSTNEEALNKMRQVNESNDRSVDAIANIARQAESCNEAVQHIKNAADTIAAIAGQTNLLALNASIEAARAGESGRGFAVVADNIRELAEQSNKSAGEIAQSVHDVVTRVQECASMAAGAKKMMEEQKELVSGVTNGMNDLSAAVADVADQIHTVSDDVKILDQEKDAILSNITDLSAISEENAASAEEVAASVQDVASGVEGTKGESEQMRGMAQALSDKISFFS